MLATTEGELKDSPFVPIPGSTLWRWDADKFYKSLSPAGQRNWDRRHKVWGIQRRIYKMCPWLSGPLLGMVTVFWTSLAEEGLRATIKPRWGAMTFSYLNDGMKPTLWHTYQQVMDPRGEHSGIWTGKAGAPRNRAEAIAWEAEAAAKR